MTARGSGQDTTHPISPQARRPVRMRPDDPATHLVEGLGAPETVRPASDPQGDELISWEQRLQAAQDELRQREQEAAAHELTPPELLALAAERDKLAREQDRVAAAFDEQASERDQGGLSRDGAGSDRDRRARAVAQDLDPGFADRSLAGKDRDSAAGDRGDSHDDRARSRRAREQAASDRATAATDRENATADARELAGLRAAMETRASIAQAQGMLMARHSLSPEAAFALLVRLSQHSNTKLRDLAVLLIATALPDRE